jgi:2-furoyl-CoA dehydrogenase large subunit
MASPKWVGVPLKRKEDPRFLTGQGHYTDEVRLPGMFHAALLRSPYAHARIKGYRLSKARAAKGVVFILTGEDVARLGSPTSNMLPEPYSGIRDYCMAVGKVRYAGEPVAAVVAESKYLAEDAAELVQVDYEPLVPVLNMEEAGEPESPLVHDEMPSNVVWHKTFECGDVDAAFRRADHVTKARLHFHRFTSAPLEPSVVLASYDRQANELTIWSNNQRPVFNRRWIAEGLNFPEERFRFITPDIGGGFGIKNDSYPYLVLVSMLSMQTGRPVKWVEDRIGHMQASAHGNEIIYEGEMALRADGAVLALRATAIHDEGAYIRREPIGVINFMRHATVGYTFQNIRMELKSVVTNKCPVGPNRSYGKMQQCFLVERLLDIATREMGLDPIETRLRNFVTPEQMPYETPTGCILDGGDYPRALRTTLELVDYEKFRKEQEEGRHRGQFLGIGLAMGMDACPVNSAITQLVNEKSHASGDSEAAWIRIEEKGQIVASTGSVPQGQGHETVVSQLVADELGVTPDEVTVLPGFDSTRDPATVHSGTYASRFAIVGVGAVLGACRRIREKITKIAAYNLKVDPGDLELEEGRVFVRGTRRGMSLAEVAHAAWRDLAALPPDLEAGLMSQFVYRPPFEPPKDGKRGNFSLTYSYSVAAVVVEVDIETGRIKLRRVAMVDDCGKRLNPLIVEGQLHGQIAHQLGAAIYEGLFYDENGQLLTATLNDYLAPSAADFPHFDIGYVDTPSLFSPMGARGMGEGGGSPLIAAANAVSDALGPLRVEMLDSHLSPRYVFQRIGEGPS